MLKNLKSSLFVKAASLVFIFTVVVACFVVPSFALLDKDVVGTTWIFNSHVEQYPSSAVLGSFRTYTSSDFRSSRSFDKFFVSDGTIYYSALPVGTSGNFSNFYNRVIVIESLTNTSSNGTDWSTFATYLSENAIQVNSAYINGHRFFFPVGSTWSQFISSFLNDGSFDDIPGHFNLNGSSVTNSKFGTIVGVSPGDLISPDAYYSSGSGDSSPILNIFRIISNWVNNSFNSVFSVFYIPGEGLTLFGTLSIAGLSIAIGFLIFGFVHSFLKLRS